MSSRNVRECDNCPEASAGESEIIPGVPYVRIEMTLVVDDGMFDRDMVSRNVVVAMDKHTSHLAEEDFTDMKIRILDALVDYREEQAKPKEMTLSPTYQPLPLLTDEDTKLSSVMHED
jgi:hypothetical protein